MRNTYLDHVVCGDTFIFDDKYIYQVKENRGSGFTFNSGYKMSREELEHALKSKRFTKLSDFKYIVA